jgi:hypothetical protein
MATRIIATVDQPDPAEVRKGIEAFCRLLGDICALPEVVRPGRKRGEDDAMSHDYPGAARLLHERLGGEEFDGHDRHVGYIRALAVYLNDSGLGFGFGADEMTVARVMKDFARLEGGAGEAAEAETPANGWPPEDIAERDDLAEQATLELDALVETLMRIEGTDCDDLVRRGLFIRIHQLAGVVMTHFNAEHDAGRETKEMGEVVYGSHYATEASHENE